MRSEWDGETALLRRHLIRCGDSLCEEQDLSGQVANALFDLGEIDSTGARYFTRDRLRSVRELSSATEFPLSRFDYGPFGWRNSLFGSNTSIFGYSGLETYTEDQLLAARERILAPGIGSWTSEDPASDGRSYSTFRYVRNNPMTWIDPTGREEEAPGFWKKCTSLLPKLFKRVAAAGGVAVVGKTVVDRVWCWKEALKCIEEGKVRCKCKIKEEWGRDSQGQPLWDPNNYRRDQCAQDEADCCNSKLRKCEAKTLNPLPSMHLPPYDPTDCLEGKGLGPEVCEP